MNESPKPPGATPGFYKVPRRFDLSTLFVVTFVYAAFFGIMNAFGAPMEVTGIIIAGLTIVGAVQMFVPERMVRLASISCGWLAIAIGYGVQIVRAGHTPNTGMPLSMVCSAVFLGALIGYIAGTIVAGVFLVADYVRKAIRRVC